MTSYNVWIVGKVHGVGFRYYSMQMAYKYGVHGFVKNSPEGKVFMELEGEPENLNPFLEWCKMGPTGAKVKEVILEESVPKNYSTFNIH